MILEAIGEEGQIMRKYYQRRLPENQSKDYYYIMRETPNTTSLLIEYGFIDNPSDARKLQNYLLDYAEAVVRAVSEYIGIPYIRPGNQLENTYTVQRGDTLYSIARRFNTSVDNIKILNNLSSTILTPGQEILIPNVSTDTTTQYVVRAGDNLTTIANRFNVTVDELISSNNLSTTTLQIGQILTIPTAASNEQNNNNQNGIPSYQYDEYIVVPGDTLYAIANKLNTTVDDLKLLNNLTSNTLSIGQVLLIPPTDGNINTDYVIYTVQRGDSLWLIANKFNTTVDRLKQLNNISSNLLQIGQELIIG